MKYLKILSISLVIFLYACGEKAPTPTTPPTPTTLIAAWIPGTVLLNNTGSNLAGSGQTYAGFKLILNGNDTGGTYVLSSVPAPYQDANTSGNWSRVSNAIQLQNVPNGNGFKNLLSAQVINGQLKFQVEVNDPKTGAATLFFTLNKQ